MNYERITRYVLEQPWAIRPEALGVILDILQYRANGGKRTDDELEELIGDVERPEPRTAGKVAVIPVFGTIMPRADIFSNISGGTSMQKLQAQLLDADRDPDITSIVLDIASPGGSVELVPETAEVIRSLKTRTVAVANAQAASAAYWLASQADELVVTPSGEVGSIGVWTAHKDVSAHETMEGIHTTLVSAGKYKVEGHPFGPLEDEARAEMQRKVDHYYDMFINAVALGRGMPTGTVRDGFGQGRMVTAPDAVRDGMADRIATLDQVLSESGTEFVAIAASGAMRSDYFDDPKFGVPGVDDRLRYDPHTDKWSCPPTVQGDHFFGHAQPIAVCLRGRPERCITPPDGDLNGFMRHYAPAAGGARTGTITLGMGGHAPEGVGVMEAIRHYDKTDRAVADVRVGRDAYGIWFSGMIRPGTSKNDRYALAASDVSSHWEPSQKTGMPVLVGLPAVNVGGFPKGYLTHQEVMQGVAASAAISEDCGCEDDEHHTSIDLDTILAFH